MNRIVRKAKKILIFKIVLNYYSTLFQLCLFILNELQSFISFRGYLFLVIAVFVDKHKRNESIITKKISFIY